MRIELWTDIICPWCGLGRHRLDEALRRLSWGGDVEIVHRSYQLDERAPEGEVESVRTMLEKKKRMPRAQVDAITAHVEALAKAEGLSPYVVGDNRVGNTSLAHELAAFATSKGHGDAMWSKLYAAYFGEVRSIFDVESLVTLATEVGLDEGEARAALSDRTFRDVVREDLRRAREIGVGGVPFFVIDDRYAVEGAQSADVLVKVLEAARAEAENAEAASGDACGLDHPGAC